MPTPPEVFTIKDLIERIEDGEKMFIHVAQFAGFLVETELLRIPFCIKTAVAGEQVILERWDIGEDNWADGAGGKGSGHVWLQ